MLTQTIKDIIVSHHTRDTQGEKESNGTINLHSKMGMRSAAKYTGRYVSG